MKMKTEGPVYGQFLKQDRYLDKYQGPLSRFMELVFAKMIRQYFY